MPYSSRENVHRSLLTLISKQTRSALIRPIKTRQSPMSLNINHQKENILTIKRIKNRNFCFFVKFFMFLKMIVKKIDYIATLGKR